jgi:hypothetical protein
MLLSVELQDHVAPYVVDTYRMPKVSKSFRFEKKQWRRISLPILVSTGVLLIVQIVGKHLLGRAEYLALFSLSLGVFLIIGIWWMHAVFTKLKFERHVNY